MKEHAASGIPVWLAVTIPLVSAVLALLGGGVVRFVLDRKQTMSRAEGFARVVREELRNVVQRLNPGVPGLPLLPTQAWEQHSSELAAVLLADEFAQLTVIYRMIAEANWRAQGIVAPIPGAPSFPVDHVPQDVRDQRAHVAIAVESAALPTIEWLALGKAPLLRRRRVREVMTPWPHIRCRCGHRWDHHRWSWRNRGWWRLRWRRYEVRSVAHECNEDGCECRWFQDRHHRHLPRWLQRLGPGRQAPSIEPDPQLAVPDSRIPATAQPGAVVGHDGSVVADSQRSI